MKELVNKKKDDMCSVGYERNNVSARLKERMFVSLIERIILLFRVKE